MQLVFYAYRILRRCANCRCRPVRQSISFQVDIESRSNRCRKLLRLYWTDTCWFLHPHPLPPNKNLIFNWELNGFLYSLIRNRRRWVHIRSLTCRHRRRIPYLKNWTCGTWFNLIRYLNVELKTLSIWLCTWFQLNRGSKFVSRHSYRIGWLLWISSTFDFLKWQLRNRSPIVPAGFLRRRSSECTYQEKDIWSCVTKCQWNSHRIQQPL